MSLEYKLKTLINRYDSAIINITRDRNELKNDILQAINDDEIDNAKDLIVTLINVDALIELTKTTVKELYKLIED